MIDINLTNEKVVIIAKETELFDRTYRFNIETTYVDFDEDNIEPLMEELNAAYIKDEPFVCVIKCDDDNTEILMRYVDMFLDIINYVGIQNDNNVIVTYEKSVSEPSEELNNMFNHNDTLIQ